MGEECRRDQNILTLLDCSLLQSETLKSFFYDQLEAIVQHFITYYVQSWKSKTVGQRGAWIQISTLQGWGREKRCQMQQMQTKKTHAKTQQNPNNHNSNKTLNKPVITREVLQTCCSSVGGNEPSSAQLYHKFASQPAAERLTVWDVWTVCGSQTLVLSCSAPAWTARVHEWPNWGSLIDPTWLPPAYYTKKHSAVFAVQLHSLLFSHQSIADVCNLF